MTPFAHARSSADTFGGEVDDYIDIHDWFDETKQYTGDWTHRALRHHAAGVQWAIDKFGHYINNSEGKDVPVKMIAETHIIEDCGLIPTVEAWLKTIKETPEPWMLAVKTKSTEILKVKD